MGYHLCIGQEVLNELAWLQRICPHEAKSALKPREPNRRRHTISFLMVIYFCTGLSFSALGLAASLQLNRGGRLPLRKQVPWLAAFGLACAATSWLDMFLLNVTSPDLARILAILRVFFHALSGLLLLIFGWGVLENLSPLPTWVIFIPALLIVPFAYIIAYASTTFITPSPIEIPIDIWSRYLLYLPGSILAGIGFLRERRQELLAGYQDSANLMLGAGLAFLFEAFVVGLVVPAAPYGPASYYNYDRVAYNAFIGEPYSSAFGGNLVSWLDNASVLKLTGLPIDFWRMISAFAVTFFVVRGLNVFEATQKRELRRLQEERDQAEKAAFEAQIVARQTAEHWTDAMVDINRRIVALENVDSILQHIIERARILLNADFIGLAIVNAEQSALEVKCYSNKQTTEMVSPPRQITNPLILSVLNELQYYLSKENISPDLMKDVCICPNQTATSLAIVRLNMDNRPIGVLWITRSDSRVFSETDAIWLGCMADLVVIAIQQGLMTEQLQSLSIIEERGRIARDMHDGLAQVLGYLNLELQTLEALQKQGKTDHFLEELGRMRQAIQTANADVRENILSLRTTLSSDKSLFSAIDEYVEEFGLQTGIEVSFSNEIDGNIDLSSIGEVQLVCILQEALTNVRKHAHARHVSVSMKREGNYILMSIQDDGKGFVMHSSKLSFGLQTMQERAVSAKGRVAIRSIPNQGTQVECRLPCLTDTFYQNSVPLS